jgi:Arc/MetJ-type ribon-helix-helix transcriptional regulator
MTYLTIALPEAAKAYVDQQISNGLYNTVDDVSTALIEQGRQAKQKVNVMLKSTLQKIKRSRPLMNDGISNINIHLEVFNLNRDMLLILKKRVLES